MNCKINVVIQDHKKRKLQDSGGFLPCYNASKGSRTLDRDLCEFCKKLLGINVTSYRMLSWSKLNHDRVEFTYEVCNYSGTPVSKIYEFK